MTDPMIEILSGPERRRRWSVSEKLEIVQETYEPGVTVSLIARRHGLRPNQLFAWRKLAAQGAFTATAADEEVVPSSAYRALQEQVKQLQRLLGKKTMEAEILKEAHELSSDSKKHLLRSVMCPQTRPHQALEFPGPNQQHGLVSCANFISAAGTLFPIAPCGRCSL